MLVVAGIGVVPGNHAQLARVDVPRHVGARRGAVGPSLAGALNWYSSVPTVSGPMYSQPIELWAIALSLIRITTRPLSDASNATIRWRFE